MKLYDIVFSPTGGTQKVSTLLTNSLEGEVIRIDLTDSMMLKKVCSKRKECELYL